MDSNLTTAEWRKIRLEYVKGKTTYKKLAEKYGLTFVDLQAAWDRLFRYMHSTNIAWDRVHPNQTGCMYIAKQFLAAVGADRC